MKRYILNRIDKISQNLRKKYVESIKILCVHQNKEKIEATLTSNNGKPYEKYYFKSENELNKYIEENNIQNIIRNICIDMI